LCNRVAIEERIEMLVVFSLTPRLYSYAMASYRIYYRKQSLSGFLAVLVPGVFLLACVAAAQQQTEAPASGETVSVVLSPAQCLRLIRHDPAADTSYQPGVDVHGRPVAPADLGPGPDTAGQGSPAAVVPPEKIVIPIVIDLFDRFGIPANPDLFKADAQVGEVVYQDGRLYYNGQRLADGGTDQVVLYCRKLLEAGTHD
jgi:hypothetical protein